MKISDFLVYPTLIKQFFPPNSAKRNKLAEPYGKFAGSRNISVFVRSDLALQSASLIEAKAKERQLSTLKQFTDVADLPQREAGKTRDELLTISGEGGTFQKVSNFVSSYNTHEIVTHLFMQATVGGVFT